MADAETPIVRFVDVEKTYDGENRVVRDLDLDIARGEFLTLLGPSGSGKTTCLLMLAGFESVTHGDILVEGRSITKLPPYKRDIGMVFQNYALFPHMTVAENLAFPLRVRKMAKPEVARRIAHALDMVRLGGFGDRRPGQLSGGQQQRVAVARALVFDPRIVLMDEPLGALDRQLREQMQYEIRHIHESLGVTVVYVTHDQAEALTMSNRIAVFNHGAVQQLATPEALYREPANAFVAQFIGENNRFAGEVVALDGAVCTVRIDGGAEIRAAPVNVAGVGARTSLSLRPESIVIDPPDGDYANRLDGRVAELIFLGDHLRVRLSVCGNDEFIVKLRDTGTGSAGGAEVRQGDAVTVAWHAHDCKALDAL
jgi:putative spermidine/putrescine transport system ATP-binding protein